MTYQVLFHDQLPHFSILLYHEITSTHEEARTMILHTEAEHGQCLLALRQTAGRGQYNRKWIDSGGKILAMTLMLNVERIVEEQYKNNSKEERHDHPLSKSQTVYLRKDYNHYINQQSSPFPPDLLQKSQAEKIAAKISELSFVTAVAVGEVLLQLEREKELTKDEILQNENKVSAIAANHLKNNDKKNIKEENTAPSLGNTNIQQHSQPDQHKTYCDLKLQYKWVNDLLLDGNKLGGMLHETVTSEKGTWVMISIGMNIDNPAQVEAPEILPTQLTSCLSQIPGILQPNLSPQTLCWMIITRWLKEFNLWLEQGLGGDIINRWRERAAYLGKKVSLWQQDGSILAKGIFTRIGDTGELILLQENGEEISCIRGSMRVDENEK